jgi:asparagine synthase (glutamine-hydrolysing)
MCGIAGIVGKTDLEAVQRMVTAMFHRGPDDQGIYSDTVATLGMTRLAILDLSPAAHQPMSTPDGRFWIVYNGEIYNFREERRLLEQRGHVFHSASDTEVVLHLFQEYGQECVHHLRGMFAFAVWDQQEHRLFAARDRLGIKPFLYTIQNGTLVFASELKALLSSRQVPFMISEKGLRQYLFWGSVQPPQTIISNVSTLLPGHCLWYQNGEINEFAYWDLVGSHHQQEVEDSSFEQLKERLLYELSESVRLELVSDVPLGVFLSGGLDSAAIVALMKRSGASRIRTFSIGFDNASQELDETKAAEQTARHFGTEHENLIVTGSEVARKFTDFVRALDQPSMDGLNTFFVSEFARGGVTVALSGLGGDELFAGYSRSWRIYWQQHDQSYALLSKIVHTNFGKWGLSLLPDELRSRLQDRSELGDVLTSYALFRRLMQPFQITNLLSPNFMSQNVMYTPGVADISEFDNPNLTDPIKRVSRLDLKTFMPFQLLRDMDAVSMGHSLEVRFPLIDHKIVELAFDLPSVFKYSPSSKPDKMNESSMSYSSSGAKKILLVALESDLPPGFEYRKKAGFKLPIAQWLRTDLVKRLKDTLYNPLTGNQLIFRQEHLHSLYNSFIQEEVPETHVWGVFVFLTWYTQMLSFLDD